MTGQLNVQPLDVMAEAIWQFRDSAPTWRHGQYGITATLDPFPGYGHDLAVVADAARYVTEVCPPTWDVDLVVADREEVGRSNGFSSIHNGGHYDDDRTWVKDAPTGVIFLSGKRIPPHPAMTRYLVAHEYGHNVQWMVAAARGMDHYDDALMREYATLRGLPDSAVHHGSGGRWHDSVVEVFACDFRVIVCQLEANFWPHPGITHPHHPDLTEPLTAWWTDALALLARQP